MKIFLNLSKIKLDKGRYSTALQNKMREIHIKGLNAFVQAASVRVPVYTGMARSTFVPLARVIGATVTINPRAVRRDRSPARGEAAQAFTLIQDKFTFKLKLDLSSPELDYFQYLDNNQGRSSTSPWKSLEAGRLAYKNTVNAALGRKLRNLPRIKDYFLFTRITTNG